MTQRPAPGPADLVITGCTALVHDPAERVGFAEDAAIVVRDGVITDVTTAAAAADLDAAERLDARGQAALPGLINCHTHAPMVALRGIAEDLPVEEWFNDHVWPIESNLEARDVELGARLACAELIRGGVTTFADHYFAMDTVADVVAETGLRALLGQAYFSSQGPEGREASLDFALRRAGAADGRVTTCLAPHAPYTVDDADLAATAGLARDHGLLVHLHAAESRAQSLHSIARHGLTPIEVLRRAGLLDVDVLIAHGTGILDRDTAALRAATGRVAVASAPRGYLKFAWGPTPLRLLADLGIPVGLATDGAASNNSLDVWESMALTALVQKSATGDPRWLTSRQALHHATLQSARAVGLGERIGSLAPGRRADIVLVDLTGPHTQPVHDLAATLVHSARSGDVRTTIVDGRVLMRDRELLTVDVPAVTRELAQRLPALVERGHGRRIQEYDA
ncbi:amidohydrolase [Streptomyces spectabilis]|uniref:5-methylthioadenosine/S-adenosylhomocysteine deaminase n=1 Tax=Streptomyces spectabilis TaxID=68270 RepID=A0A5P2X8G6_STRST|nr:amidohydrolase [Streptomyces spectabilis]MBB5102680.1 5-methylthioadenosine/S-adenosylhomocysteine deaminase [Streptomyces spectabilis]MCI3901883.1 amidohydrolase [Streptomyces spectabilis]QEV59300.1 amidohydrolase [Streptomyces spectabilis]GGV17382.1 hydrolase [Streptomyces spectabilis]